jgi:hypothetical protein
MIFVHHSIGCLAGMDRVGLGSGQNRYRIEPKPKSREARDRPGQSDGRDQPARRPIGAEASLGPTQPELRV